MDTDRDEPVVVTAVDGGLAVVSTAYAEAGVCFFESSEDAHHALDRLLSTGLPPNFDIEVLEMDPGLVWGTA